MARNIFRIDSIDCIHNGFHKPAIENFTAQIKMCYPNYKYPEEYIDHEMGIIFPSYLIKLTYGFTDNQFTIRFDDERGDRTICIYYDFANKMKTTLLNYSKNDGQKVKKEKINGKEIIFSKNWEGRYTASIFLDNGISVAYYTKDTKYSTELQESILGFSIM